VSEKVARYRCQHCWRHVRRAAYFGVHPRLWCARCKATQTFKRVPERLWPPPPRRTGDAP
jgi:predicted amidophosphoribosyltransferase